MSAPAERPKGRFPNPNPKGQSIRKVVYSVAETRQHMQLVEQLAVRGMTNAAIARAAKQQYGLSGSRVARLLERVHEAWREEDADNRKASKSAQVRRLKRYIQENSGVRDPKDATGQTWLVKPDYNSLARFESLLSDVEGTREPITIDLNVRVQETVLNVIAGLGPEELAELVSEYDETRRLAEAARSGLVVDMPQDPPRPQGPPRLAS